MKSRAAVLLLLAVRIPLSGQAPQAVFSNYSGTNFQREGYPVGILLGHTYKQAARFVSPGSYALDSIQIPLIGLGVVSPGIDISITTEVPDTAAFCTSNTNCTLIGTPGTVLETIHSDMAPWLLIGTTITGVTVTFQSTAHSRIEAGKAYWITARMTNPVGVDNYLWCLSMGDTTTPRALSPDGGGWSVQPGNAGPAPAMSIVGIPVLLSALGSPGTSVAPQGIARDPINTATGNYYAFHADLVVPGKGSPFNFTRFYNSLDSYTGPLGAGWTHSFNIALSVNGDGSVSVKEADGHQVSFRPRGGTGYSPATPGVFDALIHNTDGTFTLTRKNQTRLNFSSAGILTTIADRNGNTQTLTYNASGDLTKIVDTAGRTFTLASDANGRITSLTDPLERSWQYAYDANGNLTSVRDPAGGITQYAYDENHHMISATDARGVTYVENKFDNLGRVIRQSNARGFATTLAYGSPAPGATTFRDPLGHATQHVYDENLRLIKVVDANGGVISYAYDASNNRTSFTNQNGNATSVGYDSQGNVVGITDALENTTAFSYDARNNLQRATNPNGKTTSFSYDVHGNLTNIRDPLGNISSFSHDPSGLLLVKADARGNHTTFSYDTNGDLTRIKASMGDQISLGYDAIGRLVSSTDSNGHTAGATYDELSRLVKTADPLGNETQLAYDPIGNLEKLTDANGNATSYSYDSTNNLTTVADALKHVTTYAYDANNNRVKFTNAKRNTTTYVYDALNRLSRTIDPLSFVTSYAYDAIGNVQSKTDANGRTNQFSYDALNRLTKIAYADGNTVSYSYDPDGDRTAMTDTHGTTTYVYDADDRLSAVESPGGKTVFYAYDRVGNRESVQYPDGKVVAYTYNRDNWLTGITDWLGRNTSYGYDLGGNLTRVTYPNGAGLSYRYDAANRLLQVTNRILGSDEPNPNPASEFTYTLDAVGNRLKVVDARGISSIYTYDALDELTSANVAGNVARYTYDTVGNRLTEITPAQGSTAYSYDADDRLIKAGSTQFTYDANGNQISKKVHGTGPQTFAYDAANHLFAVTGGGTTNSFAYDGEGNRISQTTHAGTYTYVNDVSGGLSAVLQESGPDGNISYAYGLNRVSESSPSLDYFYQYDGLGSVVGLTDLHGKLEKRYVYDAFGTTAQVVPPNTIGTESKFQFTGEALDPGTGLYYLRARYYDSGTGRLLTRDSIPGTSRHPLSQNRYAYGLSNPLRFADPSGRNPIIIALGILGTIALVDAVVNIVDNGIQAVKNGRIGVSQYGSLSQCLANYGTQCPTVTDQQVNGASGQQVQGLRDLSMAGSQAGELAANGTNVAGQSNPFSEYFDLGQQILDLTTTFLDFFAPLKAQASTLPPSFK